jgi:S1-C subfamily serine protease
VLQDGQTRQPVGTAFAIDANGTLATNAHVASPIADALQGTSTWQGQPMAIPDGGLGTPRAIVSATVHRAWKNSVENDVGLLRLESGPATVPLRLATTQAARGLQPGTPIVIYAFPAAFTDASKPQGSLLQNNVREVNGAFLEVGIAVAPGASGSPAFTYDGLVVGVIAGRRMKNGKGDDVTAPAVAVTIGPLLELLAGR